MPKSHKSGLATPNTAQQAKRAADIARQQAQMDDVTLSIYKYVRDYLGQHQRPPTLREIADSVFISYTSVYRHIDLLVGMGWLYREHNIPRSVVLGQYAPDYHGVAGQDDAGG